MFAGDWTAEDESPITTFWDHFDETSASTTKNETHIQLGINWSAGLKQ
jgi:hypothetical protein